MGDNLKAESLPLLWLLAAAIGASSFWVAQRWAALARLRPRPAEQWPLLALGALALGSGLCVAIVLALVAEPLPFPLGFEHDRALLLWLGGSALCLVPLGWAAVGRSERALIGSGALMGLMVALSTAGWIEAAGLRPGVAWHVPSFVGALLLLTALFALATWCCLGREEPAGQRSVWWQVGGVLLVGVGLTLGLDFIAQAGRLTAQSRSMHQGELPALAVGLVGGALMPFLLSVMVLNQMLRSAPRRRSHSRFNGPKRRKMKYRERRL